ncbi:MAG: hypothetical protein HYZ34_12955 [Ignavibacteriae bacterium]|nr:hypothetical protein [Ignavibacteriota bacterium]
MTYSQKIKVPQNNQLTITLPQELRSEEVFVTIAEVSNNRNKKIELMQQAASDPLYLRDLLEVNNDFDMLEHETL